MRVIFLGTMGWYDTQLGNTLCVLVDTGEEYIIFDAGGGFSKVDGYIKDKKPIYLFLSHFHLDHIIGLHSLNKFNFSQGIRVFGPKGARGVFGTVINFPYSMPINRLKTKITVKEFSNTLKLPVDIKYKKLLHSSVCYGYRLSADDKSVVFCTDTGLCGNLESLANGADLLITESSLAPGKVNNNWPHLNPEQAALVAKNSKVKRLVLAHFDAAVYLREGDIKLAEKKARGIFKDTIAARDGLCLEV